MNLPSCVMLPAPFSRRHLARLALGLGAALGLTSIAKLPHGLNAAHASASDTPDLFTFTPFLGPDWMEPGETFVYANLASQLEAIGIDPIGNLSALDADRRADWERAIAHLPFSSGLRTALLMPEWPTLVGFEATKIDEAVEVGRSSTGATILRGRFDVDEVRVKLREIGYQPIDVAGTEVLRIREDDDFAFEDLLWSYLNERSNTIVALDHHTLGLVSTSALSHMLEAGPTISDQPDIMALFPPGHVEWAATIGITGGSLATQNDPLMMIDPAVNPNIPEHVAEFIATTEAQQAESGPMPPVRHALFGATPGGPLSAPGEEPTPTPDGTGAQAEIRALFMDRASAEAAVPLIEERLDIGLSTTTLTPWRDIFGRWDLEAVGDNGLVVIRLNLLGNGVQQFFQLPSDGNVRFLGWP